MTYTAIMKTKNVYCVADLQHNFMEIIAKPIKFDTLF